MGPFAFGRISTTPNLGAGQGLRGVAPAAFSRLNNVPPGRPAAITNCESITSRTTGEGASQTKAAPLYVLFGRETDNFWSFDEFCRAKFSCEASVLVPRAGFWTYSCR